MQDVADEDVPGEARDDLWKEVDGDIEGTPLPYLLQVVGQVERCGLERHEPSDGHSHDLGSPSRQRSWTWYV